VNRETWLPCFFRPLSIASLNKPLPENVSHEPGGVALMILADLVGDRADPLGTVRRRYNEASNERSEPPFVPLHDAIMRHVIRPLAEAKRCYVLGMPVACIAQAGLVGEMVALWRFRMLEPTINGRPREEVLQEAFGGRDFDRLGQEERVRVLRTIEAFDDETVQAFGQLRSLRRQYLHFMVDPLRDIERDARNALGFANMLVVKTLNLKIQDGRVLLPPKVMRYLQHIVKAEG
jgi:hypothetical protein